MEVDTARDVLKKKIRKQLQAVQTLVDGLPESEEKTLAELDEVKESVREMRKIREGRNPKAGEKEPYPGAD